MRAVLVVNPKATGTNARMRDVLGHALSADMKVETVTTERRGHATEVARRASDDGVDVVVALGGDGTINEVVNGMLANGAHAGLPALGIVPAGCTNVLARSLGLPTDPVEATSVLLDGIRDGRTRSIGLGRADERWFTFCAGLGLDAATVRRVETGRKDGSRVTSWRYARAALSEYFLHTDHGRPALTVSTPNEELHGGSAEVFLGLVCNTSPWTYLGDRPVDPCPQASFETGLDLFGLTRMRPLPTLRVLGQLFRGGPRGKRVISLHDLRYLTISSAEPLPLQVDGDDAGTTTRVQFTAVANALRVIVGEPEPAG